MKATITILTVLTVTIATVGCGSASDSATSQATAVSFDGSKYVLADEPDGAVGVIAARGEAKDGDSIVMVGRVGGATNPWIEGRAAFTLLDASKSVVATGSESKDGEICMGDCCANERAACTALVTVVDDSQRVIPVDSRKLFGLAANDMVVVRGKAKKDESGNFAVVADGVYIRR